MNTHAYENNVLQFASGLARAHAAVLIEEVTQLRDRSQLVRAREEALRIGYAALADAKRCQQIAHDAFEAAARIREQLDFGVKP